MRWWLGNLPSQLSVGGNQLLALEYHISDQEVAMAVRVKGAYEAANGDIDAGIELILFWVSKRAASWDGVSLIPLP